MSKYRLGDYDYQIPGNPEEQKDWEIGRLRERIAQLEECLRAHPDRLIGPPDLLEWEEQKDALLAKGAKE